LQWALPPSDRATPKFIDGLDANCGEINLDIFEDLYPDRAHFVSTSFSKY
jgi:hypothetical protein